MEIPRSTLSNLENGRRQNIGVDELLVIAGALGVAPVFLLAPIGFEEQVEVLPGDARPAAQAAEWIAGDRERRWPPPEGGEDPYATWSQYHIVYYERDVIWRLQGALDEGLYEPGYIERERQQVADLRVLLDEKRAREAALATELNELEQRMPELAPAREWERLLMTADARGRARVEVTAVERDLRHAEESLRRAEKLRRPEQLSDRIEMLKELRHSMRRTGMRVSAVSPQLAELLKEDVSPE